MINLEVKFTLEVPTRIYDTHPNNLDFISKSLRDVCSKANLTLD